MEFNILIGWRRIVAFGSLDEATLFRLAEDTTWLDGQTWRLERQSEGDENQAVKWKGRSVRVAVSLGLV